MNTQENYSIEAASFRIGEFASHNFWILRDPGYKVASELHGLATSRKTGRTLPIGRIGDRLGFYEFIPGKDCISVNGTRLLAKCRDFKIMYRGGKADVLDRWYRAVDLLEFLNQKNIDYSPFGIFGFKVINSNSAYRFFAQAMEIEHYSFPGLWEPGINTRFA